MNKRHFLLSIIFLLIFSIISYAQTTVLNFDGTASQWVIGKAAPENTFSLTDNFNDYEEGVGSLEILAEIKVQGAGWGTWTDAGYKFSSAQNWTGATDLRLRVKIKQNPVHNRSLQFTFDIFDSTAAGIEGPWRYMEDLDFLYHNKVDAVNGVDDWHDLVIPLSRMAVPGWATTFDGKINLESILSVSFGIHSDSSGVATDTVVVLFDDLRISSTNVVGSNPLMNCDGNAANWVTSTGNAANTITVTDEFTDYYEGVGSHKVTVYYAVFGNSWGDWTDAKWNFPAIVDLTGATELRFWMKIVDPAKRGLIVNGQKASSNSQFTFDIFENADLWRWLPSGGGLYGVLIETNKHGQTHADGGWNEMVIPFADFGTPSWSPSVDGEMDLDSVKGVGLGIHGDSNLASTDTVIILIDNFYATGSKPVGIKDEESGIYSLNFSLDHNYPNPFNPSTTISFTLPEDGFVSLKVYDIQGREIYTIVDNRYKIRGSYEYNVDFSSLASGVYFYTLQQNSNVLTKKMTLIK